MPDSTSMNKRQRLDPIDPTAGPPIDDGFIQDQDAGDSGADDDEDEDKPKSDKKAGRRKIKIEFIQDKSRRHITFSKRKAGIMKKAYELSTLTGTQVLLLVVSETGLVYTFTTAKLQPLVTQPEGKNLIQACLNAPHGQLPSTMPVGTPLGRSSAMSGVPHSPAQPAAPPNVPGGLSIGGKEDDGNDDGEAAPTGSSADSEAADRSGRKRRRASSTTTAPNTRSGPSSASASSGGPPPPPPPPPSSNAATGPPSGASQQPPPPPPPSSSAATSPHSRQQMPLPGGLSIPPPPQGQQMQPQSPSYTGYPTGSGDPSMYGGYGGQPQGAPQGNPYGYAPAVPTGHEQQQTGMAWGAPGVQQGNHYQRR